MTLSVASNPASIAVQRQLQITTEALSSTFERLSSGLRINHPSDDAAGLALADSLRNDAKIATVAIRNANDGLSLTSVADSGLSAIGNVLRRMAELANQSANGVYTNSQRSALSTEFISLGSEIQRIATVTTFNNMVLLSASSNTTIQVGFDATSASQITIGSVLGTLSSLGLSSTGNSRLTYSIIDTSTAGATAAAARALSAVNAAITTLGVTRGTLAGAESRLSTAVSYVQVLRENLEAADSRIRDADVAQEVANLVRLQVLQQAETAILAQANLQPSVALNLLK